MDFRPELLIQGHGYTNRDQRNIHFWATDGARQRFLAGGCFQWEILPNLPIPQRNLHNSDLYLFMRIIARPPPQGFEWILVGPLDIPKDPMNPEGLLGGVFQPDFQTIITDARANAIRDNVLRNDELSALPGEYLCFIRQSANITNILLFKPQLIKASFATRAVTRANTGTETATGGVQNRVCWAFLVFSSQARLL
uniref:Uncharacterized protein n=1 Tax=Mycena chlorophos TaxID=658473 RepID=A0ABQ0M3R9_MYCCL|nr:predicted protein [Mycena chlorophos]